MENATKLVVVDRPKFFYLFNQQPAFALTLLPTPAQRILDPEKQPAEFV